MDSDWIVAAAAIRSVWSDGCHRPLKYSDYLLYIHFKEMWRTLAAAPASERLAAWVEIETQVESQGEWVGAVGHGGAGDCYNVMMHCGFLNCALHDACGECVCVWKHVCIHGVFEN